MSMLLTIAAIVLIVIVIFQIAKASEYVSALKGDSGTFNKQSNKINGSLMIAFLVLGLIGVFWCNHELYPETLFPQGSASVEGENVDKLLYITIALTGVVFFITQILLFVFAYKYQYKENKKIYFFPHNTRLEIIWTSVPTIVLLILIAYGLRSWFIFTGDAPKNSMQIEVTGHQFGWIFRYPGKDGEFGKKYFKDINANNGLGLIWKDSAALNQKADPATFDDITMEGKVYLVKGKPVKFLINSQDVIHDVGLPQFRLKMDAVPGTPTTLWFTPKYTTEEMKQRTGNPNFVYELSCDQLCGRGHYSMRAEVVVLTQPEFDAVMAKQKPAYYLAFPDKDPSNIKPAADSTKPATDSLKTVAIK
ncbi:cytochrome C oxidase subunit II [Arachidicoccus ginsenosidimutans]|uniref:cytochrome c oxidase subunit II n=1 Tax=Arachidicoccus sp. BS20 TaxID=1850526 RepID=UPI0007F06A3B|nr:cytochrome c oxidase subunit II [Arachidicoccus sp. BS20]ANI90223.1 cytochrome C oxidase subunit II [Arachidicoccus sp. BS20]